MRVIKFRAWDSSKQKMHYCKPEMVNFVTDGHGFWYMKDIQSNIILADNHSVAPMQYTGLKDKNGVEIYERDIVKFVDNDGCYKITDVYFDDELLEFGLHNSFNLFNAQFGDSYEVIGNIYENQNILGGGE